MIRVLLVTFSALGLAGCWEENLERANFNAIFYYPGDGRSVGREVFLGEVLGLSACQAAASAKAASLNMSRSARWSYICCRKTAQSNCESKHR